MLKIFLKFFFLITLVSIITNCKVKPSKDIEEPDGSSVEGTISD
jgi:hypothetical protein